MRQKFIIRENYTLVGVSLTILEKVSLLVASDKYTIGSVLMCVFMSCATIFASVWGSENVG